MAGFRLSGRVEKLEAANGANGPDRAVMLTTPEESEADAITKYESQHGPIGDKEPFFISLVGVKPNASPAASA